jgi:hypothetical protein
VIDTLAVWHELVRTRDATKLTELLADDVVFHSPVVHTPQRGKAITTMYLRGALHVLRPHARAWTSPPRGCSRARSTTVRRVNRRLLVHPGSSSRGAQGRTTPVQRQGGAKVS